MKFLKQTLSLMIYLILIFSIIPLTYSIENPIITATLMSQDPDPVEPGQIVTVKFKIENEGKESSEDVIVKVLPKFPFELYGDISEKNVGKLRAASTGADAVVVEYKLKVDDKAVEGENHLDLSLKIGDSIVSYRNNEFLINIQTHDAVLEVTSVNYEPQPLVQGESADVVVQVKNKADSLLKDIKFKLDFSSSNLPLAPYQSSSERRIAQLESNFQESLSFRIIALPNAASGLYKIPLNITYNDELGKSYSFSDVLAIIVGETPKLNAYIKQSTVHQSNTNGKITLEVANSGSSDLKFVELKLIPSDDYKLISTTNYYYLGDIDSDDTQSEDITIFVNTKKTKASIPIQLKFYDANHKKYQQDFDLELPLYSSSELKRYGLINNSNSWIYILIILLGIIVYFVYRKYKKNGKK